MGEEVGDWECTECTESEVGGCNRRVEAAAIDAYLM